MAIWQDLVDDHGFAGGYQSVKRFVRKLRGSPVAGSSCGDRHARPAKRRRWITAPAPWCAIPHSGKYRRTRLFVLTLGYSRKSVRLLVFRSSTRIWAELHEKAFRRLGGATRVVVLDNLREGVLAAGHLRSHAQSALPRRAGALRRRRSALPRRRSGSQRQGGIRASAMRRETPLKGLRFESLEEAQAYLDRWEERWADTRIHGTTKRQVAAMFAEERPALLPLPLEPFRYYQYGERTVHLDGCVEVEAAYYGAPPGWIGRRVQVQWDLLHVRLLDPKTGQLLREHLRQKRGGHRIQDEDRPSQTPLGTLQLLARTERAGRHIGALCQGMHRRQGEPGGAPHPGRASRWPRSTARASVDDACAAALEVGVCEYRFVRRYLERHPQLPLSLRQVDPLIRQLTLVPRPHRKPNQGGEPTMNLIELQACAAATAPRRHGRRAGNPTAPGPGRSHGAHRPDLVPGLRRTHAPRRPLAGAPPQAGRLPRSRTRRSTTSTSPSTRR